MFENTQEQTPSGPCLPGAALWPGANTRLPPEPWQLRRCSAPGEATRHSREARTRASPACCQSLKRTQIVHRSAASKLALQEGRDCSSARIQHDNGSYPGQRARERFGCCSTGFQNLDVSPRNTPGDSEMGGATRASSQTSLAIQFPEACTTVHLTRLQCKF